MSTSAADNLDLSERARRLLYTLVERYIEGGQPVGSKTLAESAGLKLSPATVRNVMADLEERGLVASPHTSAGRVPTVQGYRVFVDSIVVARSSDTELEAELRKRLGALEDPQHLVAGASRFLSSVTGMAGVVTLPRHPHEAVRRIEFVPLAESRVLVVVVTDRGEVQNRIVNLHRRFSPEELERVAAYLNRELRGRELRELREDLMAALRATRDHMDRIMRTAIEMAEQVFAAQPEGEGFMVAGETNLMQCRDLADLSELRRLFEAFEEQREILHVLDQCLDAHGVQIFIGEESGYQALNNCSVVTASYGADEQVLGVLAVIGPTRMDYGRVISVVDVTAKLLGAALNPR